MSFAVMSAHVVLSAAALSLLPSHALLGLAVQALVVVAGTLVLGRLAGEVLRVLGRAGTPSRLGTPPSGR